MNKNILLSIGLVFLAAGCQGKLGTSSNETPKLHWVLAGAGTVITRDSGTTTVIDPNVEYELTLAANVSAKSAGIGLMRITTSYSKCETSGGTVGWDAQKDYLNGPYQTARTISLKFKLNDIPCAKKYRDGVVTFHGESGTADSGKSADEVIYFGSGKA